MRLSSGLGVAAAFAPNDTYGVSRTVVGCGSATTYEGRVPRKPER
jgi:hypothetical protein